MTSVAVTGRSGGRYHFKVGTKDTLVQLGQGEFTPTAGWVELSPAGEPVEAVFTGPWARYTPTYRPGAGSVRYVGVELGAHHLHRWQPVVRTAVAAALLAFQNGA